MDDRSRQRSERPFQFTLRAMLVGVALFGLVAALTSANLLAIQHTYHAADRPEAPMAHTIAERFALFWFLATAASALAIAVVRTTSMRLVLILMSLTAIAALSVNGYLWLDAILGF